MPYTGFPTQDERDAHPISEDIRRAAIAQAIKSQTPTRIMVAPWEESLPHVEKRACLDAECRAVAICYPVLDQTAI